MEQRDISRTLQRQGSRVFTRRIPGVFPGEAATEVEGGGGDAIGVSGTHSVQDIRRELRDSIIRLGTILRRYCAHEANCVKVESFNSAYIYKLRLLTHAGILLY